MNKLFQKLLEVRGVGEGFLTPKYENLTVPEKLPDMEKVVKRIILAKEQGDKVLVYGDYDVDGVTATTILCEALKMTGITGVETMLPDRFVDGYGMSKRLVERVKKEKIDLVITVDCGSNNEEIITDLNKLKTDVIVTDHHEVSGEIPDALAVINPKRPDFRESDEGASSLEELSGAGVAFMLAKALVNAGQIPEGQEKWLLDLAMIGTICDSMTLTKDNRIICYFGMIVLAKTKRLGLKELMRVAKVSRINTDAIGFQIGPRLNAAGRMETAELALKLLRTESKVEAAKTAEELDRLNQERRTQQNQAIIEVEKEGVGEDPVIIVRGNWSEGVIGIIAGRLTEKYKKPSFVLTEVDGDLKGSGRSFGEFNLALALSECQKLLVSGGGHAAACGLKLKEAKYEEFKKEINSYYAGLGLKNQERFLDTKEDVEVDDLGDLNLELLDGISKLEPFGEGNPAPVFLIRDAMVLRADKMGEDGKHLRMLIGDSGDKTVKLVAFNAPKEWLEIGAGARVNIWMSAMENEWNGTRSLEGMILKLRYAD